MYPMVALATAATVIASQAVISGAYSATRQAIQLGYLPRMAIRHTSRVTIGQIYIPSINWMLMLAVIATVLGFGSSTALATAYGVSVTGTMLITSIILIVAFRERAAIPPMAVLAAGDAVRAGRRGVPVRQPGEVHGRRVVPDPARHRRLHPAAHVAPRPPAAAGQEIVKDGIRLDTFLPGLMLAPPARVPGTAVFLSAQPGIVPKALLHNLKHNKVLHERNVVLTVETMASPTVPAGARLRSTPSATTSIASRCATASWKRRTCRWR